MYSTEILLVREVGEIFERILFNQIIKKLLRANAEFLINF